MQWRRRHQNRRRCLLRLHQLQIFPRLVLLIHVLHSGGNEPLIVGDGFCCLTALVQDARDAKQEPGILIDVVRCLVANCCGLKLSGARLLLR